MQTLEEEDEEEIDKFTNQCRGLTLVDRKA
jgi:hypothetical protein